MQNLFYAKTPLVLASSSPRRQLFLQELGLAHTVVQPDDIEPTVQVDELAHDYAQRAAYAKAYCIAQQCKNNVIIAADTVVVLDGKIYGKPKDEEHALEMLQNLSGRAHVVISAVSIILTCGKEISFYESTEVILHDFHEKILKNYIGCGEPMDKAGSYAIQGQGAFLVDKIQGSWSCVVGLPLSKLVQVLLENDCIAPL